MSRTRCAVLALLIVAATLACERETRRYREIPAASTRPTGTRLSDLIPGQTTTAAPSEELGPYDENGWGISEGGKLFEQFNCVGCHAHGGGGMGPALMDDEWRYGGDAPHIYATIVEGRPNGMPAFGGRIPNAQVWQIVAYIKSLSGRVPKDAAPSRSDSMQYMESLALKEREGAKATAVRKH